MSTKIFDLKNLPDNFVGGKISSHVSNWEDITSDNWVLNIVQFGYDIEFEEVPPECLTKRQIIFNSTEEIVMSREIDKLLSAHVIRPITRDEVKYVSSIFLRPKRDGSYRLILNLKNLNDYVDKLHFKMENLKSALTIVTPNCFFGCIDLKQAYFSIPVSVESQGWLVFWWHGQYFAFTVLANGLSSAPRVYTKIMKPVFSSLRKIGHNNVSYIDDSLLKGDTREECAENIFETVQLVDSLGFTVHPEKSVLFPTQEIVFVGFIINSVSMTIRLTPEKAEDIVKKCLIILSCDKITIRDLAKLIGKMVASEPGVQYAPLFYKPLEIEKDAALKGVCGNFDSEMSLSSEGIDCVKWWISNVRAADKPIIRKPPDIVIESDSSLTGWGAINKSNFATVSGIWSKADLSHHINYLETKAAFLALQHFCDKLCDVHVRLFLDNVVAIKYLSKLGGRKVELNRLTKEIWEWCMARNIWISAFHIPGKDNSIADKLSRNFDREWLLSDEVFYTIQDKLGVCDIDLFASKDNHKLSKYVSYTPDANAVAVNAFSLTWTSFNAYVFPPFSLLGLVLQKIMQDQATVTLVAPVFHTQPWFVMLLQLTCHQPYLLPKPELCLTLPNKEEKHPLKKMRLGVFKVSGKPYLCKEFRQTLPTSFYHRGDFPRRNSMGHISKDGCSFVIEKKLISLIPI